MPPTNKVEEPQLEVSKSSDWATSPAVMGLVTQLPSGKIVRVKRTMDLMHLLKTGRIPNPLAGIVQKMIDNKDPNIDIEDLDTTAIQQMLAMVDATVLKCVTEPVVEIPPEPDEDEDADTYAARIRDWQPAPDNIALSWIDIEDRMFIFTFAQGLAADLASFREETQAAMAHLRNEPAVPPKAKRATKRK